MYYAGIDVASKGSFLYVRDRRGNKVEGKQIATNRRGISEAFRKYQGKKIIVAIETGGSTRWIYDLLTKIGIEVYIVNPNKVKAIADSKKKTDKIDAKILSELLRIDALPERVHMPDENNRQLRDLMQARQAIVKAYTNLMNHSRGLLRQEGYSIKTRGLKNADYFSTIIKLNLPQHIKQILEVHKNSIETMLKEKRKLEEDIIKEYKSDDIELIKTIPGMGDISSRTIQAAIGEIKRFKRAKQLTSYCGLVPSVRSSGERTEYGHITREGRSEVRRVGIQSAHAVLRGKSKEYIPLKIWHAKIARRRGYKTALVALARKLITIVFYVLRDRKEYDYTLLRVA